MVLQKTAKPYVQHKIMYIGFKTKNTGNQTWQTYYIYIPFYKEV